MKYKVRFANPQKQYKDHREEFIKTFDDILTRGDIVMRKDLEDFENSIAKFVGVNYAIGVNSGTSAQHLAMLAAGIGEGDEVIVPSFTFAATANSVRLTGATPVFVDIEPEYFCINS